MLISHAVIGIMIPLTSKKPVVSHWTSDAEMSKASIKVGKAVVNNVWFKTVQNVPISKTITSKERL